MPVNDSAEAEPTLKRIGGSRNDDWNIILANQTLHTLWIGDSNEETKDRQYNGTLFGLAGIAPKDELEAMIAAQLIAAHNAAMECYRRATISGQTFEGRREALSQANRLSRTYAVLADALNRSRGKGQQTIRVEHVMVQAGGQAIVGHVEAPGGGGQRKSEEQPHAIAYAPAIEMRSADAGREAVPCASDAERPVQDARRKVARRPEGK